MGGPTRGVLPPELVEVIEVCSRDDFVQELDSPILLVQVEHREDEIAVGLAEGSASRGTRLLPTLGYETVNDPVDRREEAPGTRPLTPRMLAAQLAKHLFFGAPLRKRTSRAKPFEQRISVGRARNNDVVLRHASVSKFHAWFECDEDETYYVADARSTNKTSVNGERVAFGPIPLAPGDEVRFGDVRAVLCTAGLLWDACKERAG